MAQPGSILIKREIGDLATSYQFNLLQISGICIFCSISKPSRSPVNLITVVISLFGFLLFSLPIFQWFTTLLPILYFCGAKLLKTFHDCPWPVKWTLTYYLLISNQFIKLLYSDDYYYDHHDYCLLIFSPTSYLIFPLIWALSKLGILWVIYLLCPHCFLFLEYHSLLVELNYP